jgi:hypothetical protein
MKRIPRCPPLHDFCVIVALTIVTAPQAPLAFDPNEWPNAQVLEEVCPTIEIATHNRMENYVGMLGRTLTPLLLNQFQWRLDLSPSQLRPVDHIASVGSSLTPNTSIWITQRDRNPRREC